jgi:asparagine synthase (glutamine-hydrolysing)
MCGILGCVLRDGAPPLRPEAVAAARDRMAARGPDDRGLVGLEGGRVVLAHRRLSIHDLSAAGRQPMRHASRPLWLTYNGEVYNFLSLREELGARGAAFRSRTDTEVVLHLYAEMGDDLVTALRGMFAFGLWDGERKRLLLVRDRVGKKPLYYADTERGLAFASTIPALLALGLVEPRLDESRLPEYLALGRVGAPDTLLRGVSKLPPGHLLVHEGGRTVVRRWFEPRFDEAESPPGDERLAEAVAESVRLRLLSEVPLGVTLSGGVDSSLVAALAAKQSPDPIRTFTVAFDDQEMDESAHARRVAAHLGAAHHEVRLTAADVEAALPEVEAHVDEPHPNLIWPATWFVCRLAKENGVTVLLTGDGGDELFFGYRRWVALLRAYRRWLRPVEALPGALRGATALAARAVVRDEGSLELLLRASRRAPVYWGPMFFHPASMAAVLSAGGREVLRNHPPDARLRRLREETGPMDFAQWVRRTGLEGHLVEDFLARLDRMGMAVSVEGRAPLLDQEVLALAQRWPLKDLVRDGRGKAPLRRLVGALYPRAIIERPKAGFCAPVKRWLGSGLRALAAEGLEALAADVPLFDRAALARLAAASTQDRRAAARVWTLVALSRWLRRMRAAAPASAACAAR